MNNKSEFFTFIKNCYFILVSIHNYTTYKIKVTDIQLIFAFIQASVGLSRGDM